MKRAIIMGAAGRDFHNFNVFFRDNEAYRVAAFTATQIPDIEGRRYPPELAGELYPEGVPIHDEEALPRLIRDNAVDFVEDGTPTPGAENDADCDSTPTLRSTWGRIKCRKPR